MKNAKPGILDREYPIWVVNLFFGFLIPGIVCLVIGFGLGKSFERRHISYSTYAKECYKDSTAVHVFEVSHVFTTSGVRIIPGKNQYDFKMIETGEMFADSCTITTYPRDWNGKDKILDVKVIYEHKQPTAEGFVEWSKSR